MVEVKVNASKIKGESADTLTELAAFLKEKTGGEVSNDGGKMVVKTDATGVNKKYVKVLLNKFLHHKEFKATYRVIAGEDDTLTLNERKIYEAEE
jgi:hypothetical protein